MAIKARRGTDANRLLITPVDGEMIYTTDTKKFYLGDGVTVGGNEVGSGSGSGGGIGEFIGTGNIAVSQDNSAGSSVTIGAYNTTMSIFAGDAITSGSNNLCIGGNSGTSITTTSGNVALGSNAGRFIKGSSNIAVGQSALFGNSTTFTGSFNTGVGFETGQSLTTGQYNVLNGYQAGYSLTSGSDNVALGRFALKGAGGAYNIGIGYQAGVSINGGTKNILLGYNAGYSVTSGTDNVFIGSNASQNSGGSNSVGIGSFAGGSGSKSVSIGYQAGKNDTASDKLHIANNSTESLIEGNFSARTLTVNGSLDVEAITVGGAAIGGGGAWTLIDSTVVSTAVPTIEFTNAFDGTYKAYRIIVHNLGTSGANETVQILFKIGTVWETSANYWYSSLKNYVTTSFGSAATAWALPIVMNSYSGGKAQFEMVLMGGENGYARGTLRGDYGNNTSPTVIESACSYNSTGLLSGIRFQLASGANISSGSFSLIGLT